MTVRNSVVTIGATEGTLLNPGQGNASVPQKVLLTPDSANTGTVYIGGTGVTADATATGGTPLPVGGLAIDLLADDIVKAIATGAGQKVRILQVGP